MRVKNSKLLQLQRCIDNDKQILNQEQDNWSSQYKRQKYEIESDKQNIKKLEYDLNQKSMELTVLYILYSIEQVSRCGQRVVDT